MTPAERELQMESFDQVWETIKEKHWDPRTNGVNWDSLRAVLRPRVAAARTASEARGVIARMVASLGQSHFGIYSRDLYDDVEGSGGGAGGDGWTGIDFRVVDGRALIVSVEAGSPADLDGVKPGWEILRASGEDVRKLLRRLSSRIEAGPRSEFLMNTAVRRRLQGPVGHELAVCLLDGDNHKRDLLLRLIEPRGHLAQLGELPPVYVWIDTTRVERNIGLIRFNMFLDPGRVMDVFNRAMSSWMHLDGVIIDLRGNPGGIGAMAMGMAGWFIGEKGRVLGTMYTRSNPIKFTVNPRPQTYDGPLAILVDGLTASTAEILAAGLRDLGRARLFGTPTAGAALPSVFERLPNGDGFQYAFANYISQGGEVLENHGVVPDVEVRPTREALLQGHDPALDAAVGWIRRGELAR